MPPGAERDHARRVVAARGLIRAAVAHLTRDALGTIDFAALAPVKKLLKRYFSDDPWTVSDDDTLATLVGPGEGWWEYGLDADYELEFGWRSGVFCMDVRRSSGLADTFNEPVVPEATPNPRTIRFVVASPIHDGASRWYESADDVDDARVARLFAEFPDIANVLVGPAFVAVGINRPDQWERLLDSVLRAIAREFASGTSDVGSVEPTAAASGASGPRPQRDPPPGGGRALDRAWKRLGSLKPSDLTDLDAILAAADSHDAANRQVAARLLVDADAERAAPTWDRLLGDASRGVRRATVDAIVDAGRPALRLLLERALGDDDAWIRWKALRGLVDLGIAGNSAAVRALADDPDFRVRLEASRALSGPGS